VTSCRQLSLRVFHCAASTALVSGAANGQDGLQKSFAFCRLVGLLIEFISGFVSFVSCGSKGFNRDMLIPASSKHFCFLYVAVIVFSYVLNEISLWTQVQNTNAYVMNYNKLNAAAIPDLRAIDKVIRELGSSAPNQKQSTWPQGNNPNE
jgi:hypothetical protein